MGKYSRHLVAQKLHREWTFHYLSVNKAASADGPILCADQTGVASGWDLSTIYVTSILHFVSLGAQKKADNRTCLCGCQPSESKTAQIPYAKHS
jgi:hypothetical protein